MDFDTILYIIILVASLVIGAIGKSQRNQKNKTVIDRNNENEYDAEPKKFTFEELIKNVNADKNFNEYYEDEIEEFDTKLTEKEFNTKETKINSNNTVLDNPVSEIDKIETEEGISLIQSNNEILQELKEFESENSNIIEQFDIKSAIIFSEILNRKYT